MPEASEDPAPDGAKNAKGDKVLGVLTRGQTVLAAVVALLVAIGLGVVKVLESADESRLAFCATTFKLWCPDSCGYDGAAFTADAPCFHRCIRFQAKQSAEAKRELDACVALNTKPVAAPPAAAAPAQPARVAGAPAAPAAAGSGATAQPAPGRKPGKPSGLGKPNVASDEQDTQTASSAKPTTCPYDSSLFGDSQSVIGRCRSPNERDAWTVTITNDRGSLDAAVTGTDSKDGCSHAVVTKLRGKVPAGCRYTIKSVGTVVGAAMQ